MPVRCFVTILLLVCMQHAVSADVPTPQDLLDLRSRVRNESLTSRESFKLCAPLVLLAQERLPRGDSWRLRVALDCADTQSSAGDPAGALQKFDALLTEIRSQQVNPAMEVIALKFRANALSMIGHRVEAVRELEAALALAQRRFGPGSGHALDVSMRLCGGYSHVERHDDAIALCTSVATQLASAPASDFTKVNAIRAVGSALIRRNRGDDVRRGIAMLETSVRDLEAAFGRASKLAMLARRELAYGWLRDKQYGKAEQQVRTLRQEFAAARGEKDEETVTTDALLQIILFEQQKYTDAARLADNSLDGIRDPITRLQRQLNTAVVLISMQKTDDALEVLLDWAEGAERARDELTLDPVAKAQFTQQWHSGYQYLAVAYFRKNLFRAALISLELSKARALADSMGDMDAMRTMPEGDRMATLVQLREAAQYRQLQRLAVPGAPQALQADTRAKDAEARAAQIIARHADAQVKQRIGREQIDGEISIHIARSDDDEAYLSLGYGLSGSQSLMPLLLRRGRVFAPTRPMVILDNLRDTVAAMRMLAQHGASGMARRQLKIIARAPEGFAVVPISSPEAAVEDPRAVVMYLSQKILEPFRDQLQGVRKLVIGADGPIWLVPFDLLELDGQTAVQEHGSELRAVHPCAEPAA